MSGMAMLSRRSFVATAARSIAGAGAIAAVTRSRATAAPVEESVEAGYYGYHRRCWWRNGRRYCRHVYRATDDPITE